MNRGWTAMKPDDRLREADKSWNVMVIADAIMQILQEQPEMTLLDIEDAFRRIGSKTTYLVAWPMKLDGSLAPYALWVCINGENDMLHRLHTFGLTIEQNRAALKLTRFSVPT